jgi:hypothetical protein
MSRWPQPSIPLSSSLAVNERGVEIGERVRDRMVGLGMGVRLDLAQGDGAARGAEL